MNKLEKWFWDKNEAFDKMYNALEKYVEEYSKIPSMADKKPNIKILGSFCNRMRQTYAKNKLDVNKINKLNAINNWYWIKEDTFNKKIIELKKYLNEYSKFPSIADNNKMTKSLGKWIYCMKEKYKKRNLSADKINILESLKGWQWPKNKIKKTNKILSGSKTSKIKKNLSNKENLLNI